MSTPPTARARRVVRWLNRKGAGWEGVLSEELEERIAEEIADALDELREGFLRRTRTNEPKTHH